MAVVAWAGGPIWGIERGVRRRQATEINGPWRIDDVGERITSRVGEMAGGVSGPDGAVIPAGDLHCRGPQAPRNPGPALASPPPAVETPHKLLQLDRNAARRSGSHRLFSVQSRTDSGRYRTIHRDPCRLTGRTPSACWRHRSRMADAAGTRLSPSAARFPVSCESG